MRMRKVSRGEKMKRVYEKSRNESGEGGENVNEKVRGINRGNCEVNKNRPDEITK